MASLLRRLRSWSPSPQRPAAKADAAVSDLFFMQVVAFGEVFPVPVCTATRVTAVLRYVMEAALTEEQAATLGSVEATLYHKEMPLQLEATMETLPRNSVLHLHTSASPTSSAMRDRHFDTLSSLPNSRRRDSSTTITMQPCFRDKGVPGGVWEDLGLPASHQPSSESAGLSSEDRPSLQRQESPAAMTNGGVPSSVVSAHHSVPLAGMATFLNSAPLLVVPAARSGRSTARTSGQGFAAEEPYYYFVPCAGATMRTSVPLLNSQSRTASQPLLLRSRRGDSVVAPAGNCRLSSVGVNSLDAALFNRSDPLLHSPIPSPPKAMSTPVKCLNRGDDKYLTVCLRLPYNSAASRMSAAALNTDRNIIVSEMEASEVQGLALQDATSLSVASTKSHETKAYAYRRLRVLQDFPVGTLRELFAVAAHYRLYIAHTEVKDEHKTFHELRLAPNTIFCFKKRTNTDGDAETDLRDSRPLSSTLDSTLEQLSDTVTASQRVEVTREGGGDDRCRAPSHIEPLPCPADLVFPPISPLPLSGPRPRSPLHSGGQGSTTTNTLSTQTRTNTFDDGAAPSPTSGSEQSVHVAQGGERVVSVTATTNGYGPGDHKQTLSLIVTKEVRRAVLTPPPATWTEAKEQGVDVDCCVSKKEAEAATTMADEVCDAAASQTLSALQVAPTNAVAPLSADAAGSQRRTTKTRHLPRCLSTVAEVRRSSGGNALHGAEEEASAGVRRTKALEKSSLVSWARRLVAKIQGQHKPRGNKAPVPPALSPLRITGRRALPLSSTDSVQLAASAGESLNPLATASSLPSITGQPPEAMGHGPSNFSRGSKGHAKTVETPAMAPRVVAASAMEKPRGAAALVDLSEQPNIARGTQGSFREESASVTQGDRPVDVCMPRPPVAFLGSDPNESAHQTLAHRAANVLEDISAAVEPEALITPRIPGSNNLPTPVSILVPPKRGRRSGQKGNCSAPGDCSLENATTLSQWHCLKGKSSSAYKIESMSHVHRLRITLVDPLDPTRYHYGLPVEPDCPVEELREWVTAMQRLDNNAGKDSPNFCDSTRYGIFVGDDRLPQVNSVTFAEVTSGRNDIIFSLRPL